MGVFKTCMKIVKCHRINFLVYLLLFLSLCTGMAFLTKNPAETDFEQERPAFAVVNRDRETPLVRGFETYLDEKGTLLKLSGQEKELEDALFYQEAACILLIPEGFSDSWERGEPIPLETARSQDVAAAAYLEGAAEQYWSQAAALRALAPESSQEEIAGKTLEILSQETLVETVKDSGPQVSETYEAYVRLEGYTMMVLVILLVCQVQLTFQRPEIRMRNQMSPLPSAGFTGRLMLHGAVMSLGVWALLTLMGLVIFHGQIQGLDPRAVLLLAAAGFCLMLVSLAVAELVAALTKNRSGDTLDMAANFISLGMGFLSGIFVPLELLGEGIRTAAQVTPTYWYARGVEEIFALTSFEQSHLWPIFGYLGIMAAFAAALGAVAFLIAKTKSSGEESYAQVSTERRRV